MKKLTVFILVLFGIITLQAELKLFTRQNYYTNETGAELVVDATSESDTLFLNLPGIDKTIFPGQLNFISLNLLPYEIGINDNDCIIGTTKYTFKLIMLEPKPNEVKIDRVTKGLIVNDLPFIPFGFYCYSPVQPTLAEEEIVKGFNIISPYQQILPETFEARKAYMDRCADLGMKVHYNLCSVAGGGGAGSARQNKSDAELEKLLIAEVNAFKDHPALLAWYISDEPVGGGVGVETVEKAYKVVKELDPYHPISMVFMTPKKAPAYINAMDIVMADPYPIPEGNILDVGETADWLSQKFPNKPVWIVPQAFGGGEWWKREPTHQELRYMTWTSLLNGATGIQYFVRHGMNSFPKSTTAWAECGAVALETAELTPFLLSTEFIEAPKSNKDELTIKAYKLQNKAVIIVLNNQNSPAEFSLELENLPEIAEVLFENRTIPTEADSLHDYIEAFGTKFYKFDLTNSSPDSTNIYAVSPNNIVLNPSYEKNPSVGVPAGYYAKGRSEKGATYFVDSRTSFEGEHSLRITNPKENEGMKLKAYHVRLKKGKSYRYSIWAKALDSEFSNRNKPGFFKRIFKGWEKVKPLIFRVRIGNTVEEFELTEEWQEYGFSLPTPAKDVKHSIHLELIGRGTAWFDLMQVIRDLEIYSRNEEGKIWAEVVCDQPGAEIRYTVDGTAPSHNSPLYTEPVEIITSGKFQAAAVLNGKASNFANMEFEITKSTGKLVTYRKNYRKYEAGGDYALVNGRSGSDDYRDGLWQGFISNDMDVVIDLEESTLVQNVDINFLQVINSWIFMPSKVEIYTSEDNINFHKIGTIPNDVPLKKRGKVIKNFELNFKPRPTRYIRVVGKNIGKCPNWHKGAGGHSWIFADEIRIN